MDLKVSKNVSSLFISASPDTPPTHILIKIITLSFKSKKHSDKNNQFLEHS